MRFLDRLKTKQQPQVSRSLDALALYAGGTLEIVGESHRQDVLAKVAAAATDATPLLPELKGRVRTIAQTQDRLWFRAALFGSPTTPKTRTRSPFTLPASA